MISLLLVDDHIVVGEGTKYLLEETGEITVTLCTSGHDVLDLIQHSEFDICMLDLYMPSLNGLDLAKKISEFNKNSRIIIYTGFETTSLFNVFVEAGVSGFISKTATGSQIITLIKSILNGYTILPLELYKQLRRTGTKEELVEDDDPNNIMLSPREEKILIGISKGLKNREIAEELLLSQRSVEYCLTNIYKKLNATSRTDALMKAEKLKIIHVQL
jgi:two-component system, NarL family, competent response regulator ComA